MFGMSWLELFIILIVALLVIGPEKLPEVARGLARLIRQFQKIIHDIRNSINLEEFEHKMRESSHYTPPSPGSDRPIQPIHDISADDTATLGVISKPGSNGQPGATHPAAAAIHLNKNDSTPS